MNNLKKLKGKEEYNLIRYSSMEIEIFGHTIRIYQNGYEFQVLNKSRRGRGMKKLIQKKLLIEDFVKHGIYSVQNQDRNQDEFRFLLLNLVNLQYRDYYGYPIILLRDLPNKLYFIKQELNPEEEEDDDDDDEDENEDEEKEEEEIDDDIVYEEKEKDEEEQEENQLVITKDKDDDLIPYLIDEIPIPKSSITLFKSLYMIPDYGKSLDKIKKTELSNFDQDTFTLTMISLLLSVPARNNDINLGNFCLYRPDIEFQIIWHLKICDTLFEISWLNKGLIVMIDWDNCTEYKNETIVTSSGSIVKDLHELNLGLSSFTFMKDELREYIFTGYGADNSPPNVFITLQMLLKYVNNSKFTIKCQTDINLSTLLQQQQQEQLGKEQQLKQQKRKEEIMQKVGAENYDELLDGEDVIHPIPVDDYEDLIYPCTELKKDDDDDDDDQDQDDKNNTHSHCSHCSYTYKSLNYSSIIEVFPSNNTCARGHHSLFLFLRRWREILPEE